MLKNRILICGHRSFVATGLYEKLVTDGNQVDCFSRGEKARNQDFVTGNVLQISSNKYMEYDYNIVINFIVLKDKGVSENIEYIKSLVEFCKCRKVKQLIHFSSIMVYDNNEPYIDEATEIENNTNKAGYGEVKIAVDKYLMSLTNLPFSISFIRPGYVLGKNRTCPFVKKLPLGISIIKGDKKSKQPIVRRDDIHQALLNMIKLESSKSVYLFVPNHEMTKHGYAKENFGGLIIPLPKWLILGLSKMFLKLNVINKSLFVRVEGMYIETKYNSSKTEKELNIKF